MRRRTAAGTAATLFAALAIGGPHATAGAAAPSTLRCAVATPPPVCAHLDELAAQLGPVVPILGPEIGRVVAPAQALSARSDQPGGVPTAEVTAASTALRDQLAELPAPLAALLGDQLLRSLTSTLDDIIAAVAAPVAPGPKAAAPSKATPAKTAPRAEAPTPRSSETTSFGASASTSDAGSAPSDDGVPDVPVGDPLSLAPLALPDFGFSQNWDETAAVDVAEVSPADLPDVEQVLADAVGGDSRTAELAVVVVVSLLLLGGAGVAQLQAQRHTIPD